MPKQHVSCGNFSLVVLAGGFRRCSPAAYLRQLRRQLLRPHQPIVRSHEVELCRAVVYIGRPLLLPWLDGYPGESDSISFCRAASRSCSYFLTKL